MAGYKTHITGALLFCGLLFLFPFWNPLPLMGKIACVILAIFFGLWPDVDTKSKGQLYFLILVIIANSYLILIEEYKRAAYLGLLIIIPIISRHRGWTHSMVAMILVPGAIYLAGIQYTQQSAFNLFPYYLAAVLGYGSHLVIDRIKFLNRLK